MYAEQDEHVSETWYMTVLTVINKGALEYITSCKLCIKYLVLRSCLVCFKAVPRS